MGINQNIASEISWAAPGFWNALGALMDCTDDMRDPENVQQIISAARDIVSNSREALESASNPNEQDVFIGQAVAFFTRERSGAQSGDTIDIPLNDGSTYKHKR